MDKKDIAKERSAVGLVQKPQKFRKRRLLYLIVPVVLTVLFFNDLTYVYAELNFLIGNRAAAKKVFGSLGDFKNSQSYLKDISYADACDYKAAEDYEKAVQLYISLDGYKDSEVLVDECYGLLAKKCCQKADYEKAVHYFIKADDDRGIKSAYIEWGEKLFEQKDFSAAIEKLKPYAKDEKIDAKICSAEYEIACINALAGDDYYAVVNLNRLNMDERAQELTKGITRINLQNATTLSVSNNHIVYLDQNGNVYSGGSNFYGQGDVNEWKGIVSLCAGEQNTYGLTYDGKVLAAGSNAYGQLNVSDWSKIISVCATDNAVFGLRQDGKVVFSGGLSKQYDAVKDWSGIINISAGKDHFAAIDGAGSIFSAGQNEYGQCNVTDKNNIVAVHCGAYRTILITSNGKLAIVGSCPKDLAEQAERLSDITDVSFSYSHIVARNNTGKLFAVGLNDRGQCDVAGFDDVAFFFARADFTIAVTAEGKVLTSVAGGTLDWQVLVWKQ